jgi:hypothetical protein
MATSFFSNDFWKALKRIQWEKATTKHPPRGSWVPTEDVWPYREYNRHDDNALIFGGNKDTVENVKALKESIAKSGQFEPGHLVFDPYVADLPEEGLYGMHLAEGNHRLAATRALGNPHYLAQFSQSERKPNTDHRWHPLPDGSRPPDTKREVIAKENIRPNVHNYIPELAHPSDFEEFAGKSIDTVKGKPGSPADRSIVASLGHSPAAKRLMGAMKVTGKVLGPILAVAGLASGMQDPAEALGATVDKAEGNKWAKKQYTPAVKKAEKKYYAKKQAAAEKVNPMAKYGTYGSAKNK